jgi:uncharacterized protein YjgD (DUF1641 family)
MAEPILLKPRLHDPRERLFNKLENAPQEHAEAMLSAYDLLQELHDKGILEIAKGLLGSGDKVLEILVEAGNSPEVIRGMRNLIILSKLASALDPKILEGLASALPNALEKAHSEKPLGPVGLLGKFASADCRRVMTVMANVLGAVGKSMSSDGE